MTVVVILAIAIACVIGIAYIWYTLAKIRKEVQYIKTDAEKLLQAADSIIGKNCTNDTIHCQKQPESYIVLLVRVVRRIYRTFERKKASIKRSEELWEQNRVAHMERLRRYQHSAFAKSKINKR